MKFRFVLVLREISTYLYSESISTYLYSDSISKYILRSFHKRYLYFNCLVLCRYIFLVSHVNTILCKSFVPPPFFFLHKSWHLTQNGTNYNKTCACHRGKRYLSLTTPKNWYSKYLQIGSQLLPLRNTV